MENSNYFNQNSQSDIKVKVPLPPFVTIVEMPVICHTQWNPEVEYSSIFIFVSVTWGYTDTEST